jgi:hypothetical protein
LQNNSEFKKEDTMSHDSESGGGESLLDSLWNPANMGFNNMSQSFEALANSPNLNIIFPGANSLFSMSQIFTGKAPNILGILLGSMNATLPGIIPTGKIGGIFGGKGRG